MGSHVKYGVLLVPVLEQSVEPHTPAAQQEHQTGAAPLLPTKRRTPLRAAHHDADVLIRADAPGLCGRVQRQGR